MASRAADATIKGYYYQFDTTILSLLQLANGSDFIVVEGIEDIDINTATDSNTIQCKYLSKPKFINSAVREPITLMLGHFVASTIPNNLTYTLYAHFENEISGTQASIDLIRLKDILTYSENKVTKCHHIDAGISDTQLSLFLSKFKLIFGEEFEIQQKKVATLLKKEFFCGDFEADSLFYNNALRIIIDKAIQPNLTNRTITKTDFLTQIDCRKKIFNEWYIKLRSKKDYLVSVAKNIKSTKSLEPSRSKYIIIGKELISADNSELPLLSLIENLIDRNYKMGSALRNAKPLTVILDCDNVLLVDLKKKLIESGILFNDGYEHLCFNAPFLNSDPVINRNKSQTKITKSSFQLKVISRNTLIASIASITTPKVVFNFSKEDCPYLRSSDYQLYDIKYCENLKDVSGLIA